MSAPEKLAITFDKSALDKAIEEAQQQIEGTDLLGDLADQVFDRMASPSHLGDRFVAAKKDENNQPNDVRTVIRSSGGQHQIKKNE